MKSKIIFNGKILNQQDIQVQTIKELLILVMVFLKQSEL